MRTYSGCQGPTGGIRLSKSACYWPFLVDSPERAGRSAEGLLRARGFSVSVPMIFDVFILPATGWVCITSNHHHPEPPRATTTATLFLFAERENGWEASYLSTNCVTSCQHNTVFFGSA